MKKKNLVKILSIIFTLIALSTCVALAISAAGTSVNVNDETAYRGETVTFNATLSESVVVGSGSLAISYDPNVLELTGGSCNVSGAMLANFDVAKGKGAFAFSGTNTVSGNLFTVTFRVKDAAAFGTTDVSLTVTLKDGSNKVISLTNNDGSITVKCNHSFTKEDTTYIKSEATCTSPAIYYKSCVTCGAKGTETFTYGATVEHSYTRQVTTDTYKVSSATCTAKAVYKYCCNTCNKAGTETFEYGTTLDHNYTRKVVTDTYKKSAATCTDAAVYCYCCATCDVKGTTTYTNGSELGHTGGTATCTAKAECSRCHEPYGTMLEHVYTDQDATATYLKSATTCTSKAVYYKNCATCDKAGTATFEYGSTEPHSYTKQVTTDAYKKSDASCTANAVYYYCCATCNAKGTSTFEHGTTLSHNYTRKIVTETYKKSAATCTDAAVYYYCCATCDAKGTTTYTNGSELGHTGGTATCTAKAECSRCHEPYGTMLKHVYTNQDATATYLKSAATCTSKAVYYKNCATCDKAGTATFEYGNFKAHSYIEKVEDAYLKSAATCTSKAVYYKSCSDCGVKGTETFEVGDAPSHNYQTVWSSDATSHWHECSKCGDKKDTASHTAGAAATESTAQTCTVCGYVITPALGHTHNYNTTWSNNATEHWHDCIGCSSTKDNAPHDYTNACDTDCNTCGYVRTITHSYKTEWSSNAEKHWYECSVCGDKSSEASHTPGAEATETTDQVCTVCGFVIQKALGHTHNYNTTWSNNATEHWHDCIGCSSTKDNAPHDYTNACDTDCNTCGYVRTITHSYKTEWSSNTEKHWYECSICGDKKNETVHTPGADATETTDQTCTVCGYVIKEALGHTHSHSAMKNDETNHWNECACGDKTDVAGHTWDDGVVTKEATYDAEGEKTFTCSTCSHTKIESIEKLIREDDTTTDTDVDTDVNTDTTVDTTVDTDPVEQPSGGCRSAIGIGAGSIVVIAIACGAVIFLKKKKVN